MSIVILNPRQWRPNWRVCICVLLIGLVIYNPFLALRGSSGNLSYERLARNRATIGSSELQHFTPAPTSTLQADVEVEAGSTEPTAAVQENQPGMVQPEVDPLQPELYASLWFRPPPTK